MIESAVYVYLASQNSVTSVCDNIFPHWIPADQTDYPVITITCITQTHEMCTTGNVGQAVATVQVDCWSDVLSEATDTANAVRAVMQNYSGSMGGTDVKFVWIDEERAEHEEPAGPTDSWLYRWSTDYKIKFSTDIPTP